MDQESAVDGILLENSGKNSDSLEDLPVSTWLAKKVLNLNSSKNPRRNLKGLFGPTIFPSSTAYPFIATALVSIIQVKRLWTWQKGFLVQLLITFGPILQSIRTLREIQSKSEIKDQTKHQLIRWLSYWSIYGALICLESWKVWISQSSEFRPTIYPSTQTRERSKIFEIHPLFSQPFSRLRFLLQSKTSSVFSRNSSIFKYTPNTRGSASKSKNLTSKAHIINSSSLKSLNLLPDHVLGEGSGNFYILMKVIFLRWCSGNRTMGSSKIWFHLISPLLGWLLKSFELENESSTKSTPVRKVVRVIMSEEGPKRSCLGGYAVQCQINDPTRLISPNHLSQDGPSTSGYCVPPQAPDLENPQEILNGYQSNQENNQINECHSIRRIKSDPIPPSSCNSSINLKPVSPSAFENQNTHQNHQKSLMESFKSNQLIESSSSFLPSPSQSSLSSSFSPQKGHRNHFGSNHSHGNHHFVVGDFKTPENAWDSMSLNVSS